MAKSANFNVEEMLPLGTEINHGKYRIDSYLSQSRYSNTYIATRLDETKEKVVIKEFYVSGITGRAGNNITVGVYDAKNQDYFQYQRERFKVGASKIKNLANPAIVKILDCFEDEGTAYYVMRMIEGETLSKRMKRLGKPFSVNAMSRYLDSLSTALEDIHGHKLVHLNINPDNVIIDGSDHAVLIGFNPGRDISNELTPGQIPEELPKNDNGSYSPLEQINGDNEKIGAKTDIYGLGMLLYNCLTGKVPPTADEIADPNAMKYDERVTPQMQHLIARMTNPNWENRMASIEDVLRYLGTEITYTGGGNDNGGSRRGAQIVFILFVLAVLGAIVFGIVRMCSSDSDEDNIVIMDGGTSEQVHDIQKNAEEKKDTVDANKTEAGQKEEVKKEEEKPAPEATEQKTEEAKQPEQQPAPALSGETEYLKKNDVWSSSANANSKSLVSAIQKGEADGILNHPYSKLNDKTRQNGYWLQIVDRVKEMKAQGRDGELKAALQSVYKDPLNLREVNDKLARMKK